LTGGGALRRARQERICRFLLGAGVSLSEARAENFQAMITTGRAYQG